MSTTFGFVLITCWVIFLPLAMIIVSLIAYSKSNSKRRASWFIMTGVGLMTAILATLYMLLQCKNLIKAAGSI